MTEQLELYDNDDTSFGNWTDTCTPALMMRWTQRRLFLCLINSGNNLYTRFAEAEVIRRRDNQLRRQIQSLENATEKVEIATVGVHTTVSALIQSSERLETFTRRLIKLTWFLIVVAIITAVIPIGIEIWRAKKDIPAPQIVPVSRPPKPTP